MTNLLFQCIRFEMSGMEIPIEAKKECTQESLRQLYKLAQKHDVAHLVADALDKNGLLEVGTAEYKAFFRARNLAVYRYEQMQHEFLQVCQILEKAEIDFIPLKGASIREKYPEPWLRTSCDVDILVKEEYLQSAIDVLYRDLGYTCSSIGQHDAQIFAENGVHLELHFSLLEGDSKEELIPLLSQVWQHVQPITKHCFRMEKSFNYCYTLSHMAKHVKHGGCGIRAFIDIWLLNKELSEEKAEKEALLKEGGLLAFADAVENLANVWLQGDAYNGCSKQLDEYVLTGGIYGNVENKVAARQAKKKNKISYFCSRIFLPYRQLKYKYPNLQKHPWMFPFYQIKRWLKPLYDKESKKKINKELQQISLAGQEKEVVAELFDNLNI